MPILLNGHPVTIQDLERRRIDGLTMDGRPFNPYRGPGELRTPTGPGPARRPGRPRRSWAAENPAEAARIAALIERCRTLCAELLADVEPVLVTHVAQELGVPPQSMGRLCKKARVAIRRYHNRPSVIVEVLP